MDDVVVTVTHMDLRRTFRLLDESWLDLKLAVRMLVRYPGLTVVGTAGLSVALAIAIGAFMIVGNQGRILGAIFARAFGQLGAGAVRAMGVASLIGPDAGPMDGYRTIVVPLVALSLVCVGLLAAAGPARRALGVSPSDALRSE
jgi:hypothetical protein